MKFTIVLIRLISTGTNSVLKKEFLHKCLRYFSINNIDNPCLLTIACNPKEYFELFENSEIIRKRLNRRNLKRILRKEL